MRAIARKVVVTVSILTVAAAAGPAGAWGSTGHRMIGALAVRSLPAALPAFLHTPKAAADVGELSREPDRWRIAGPAHDDIRDSLHFAYLSDDGTLGGGPGFTALPQTRAVYAAQIRKAGGDPDQTGYLPYAILDQWQQLAKDFVYWRADQAGLDRDRDPVHRAWLSADQRRREGQILSDIGLLSHFVGDATQPMHLTVHHDGWGDGPNPDGFTTAKVHVPYEGAYVAAVVREEAVLAAMAAPRVISAAMLSEVGDYLAENARQSRPWYVMEKAGAFRPGELRGAAYTAARLAHAASELRDMIAAAWAASGQGQINYPVASLADLEAGRVDAYLMLHGPD